MIRCVVRSHQFSIHSIETRRISKWFRKLSSNAPVEHKYKRVTPVEHILLRPGMYVGSVEPVRESYFIFDGRTKRMTIKDVEYIPGLLKIFDEILVNAVDNVQRSKLTTKIEVDIDVNNNVISVKNNGPGIPIVVHKDENIYVPEMVLGNLLTGSNFDDNELRFTGGRHGYGAKLTNILSKSFRVETVDAERKLKFDMTWIDNMKPSSNGPVITPVDAKAESYTFVTFSPDLSLFGLKKITRDIEAVMKRRVYDVAGCVGNSVKVYLNGSQIPISSFSKYASLFYDTELPDSEIVRYYDASKKLEVVVCSGLNLPSVSFVNGICTKRGGAHIEAVREQIAKAFILEGNKSLAKTGGKLTSSMVKRNIQIFLNCQIPNPDFDSQVKDKLTSNDNVVRPFVHLPKSFIDKVVTTTSILDSLLDQIHRKDLDALVKTGKNKFARTITGIPKLEDANWAGTSKSKNCTLILTEGDSAKALAVAGLAVIGRDAYGVYPLRGKLLNARDAPLKAIMNNTELSELCKILGLDYTQKYEHGADSLRYGKVMLMTDQDLDGSHIKGLVINFFHVFWPSLLKSNNFLLEFVTPIIKVSRGSEKLSFFSLIDYENWRQQTPGHQSWQVKYYKGLGTSTSQEGREYFADLNKHMLSFQWDHTQSKLNDIAIQNAFSKKAVQARKDWLTKSLHMIADGSLGSIDHSKQEIGYEEFINKELVLFSHYNTRRSIPSLIDGMKPSQRKILHATFKKNLEDREIKVAQLAGFCSEQTAYHHGEMSLYNAIVNMAQDFLGSNNLPLLYPSGQFGTRLRGGKDAASPRYIFTKLQEYTRALFPKADDDILEYNTDDGMVVEPTVFLPVIPMVLVNGAEGIGTGWSTNVSPHNPMEIIANLKRKVNGIPMVEMKPWYRGFKGTVIEKTNQQGELSYDAGFDVVGAYVRDSKTSIRIEELPIGIWTEDYKQYLDYCIETKKIQSYKEYHSEKSILFTLKGTQHQIDSICNQLDEGNMGALHLRKSIITTNMYLFDKNDNMKLYSSPLQIIDDYFDVRLEGYTRRREHLMKRLSEKRLALTNQLRFMDEVANGVFVVQGHTKKQIIAKLEQCGYSPDPAIPKGPDEGISAQSYNYLLNTPLWDFTTEAVAKLKSKYEKVSAELSRLETCTASDLWLDDLEILENALEELMRKTDP